MTRATSSSRPKLPNASKSKQKQRRSLICLRKLSVNKRAVMCLTNSPFTSGSNELWLTSKIATAMSCNWGGARVSGKIFNFLPPKKLQVMNHKSRLRLLATDLLLVVLNAFLGLRDRLPWSRGSDKLTCHPGTRFSHSTLNRCHPIRDKSHEKGEEKKVFILRQAQSKSLFHKSFCFAPCSRWTEREQMRAEIAFQQNDAKAFEEKMTKINFFSSFSPLGGMEASTGVK